MKILVTGSAGFIGSNFVRHLLDATDFEVITLDALTYAGSRENLAGVMDHPRHDFIEGDIRDDMLVEQVVDGVDAVVNFAAESHVDNSIEGTEPFVSTNVEGTRTLLDAARRADVDRFIQISTDEVYGQIIDGKFTEADSLRPRNPYAATKAAADHLALSYYTTYDLPVLVTRSSNNFGPRQHREKVIPKFIHRARQGESLPVYGDGTNVREWIYVTDNCRAITTVLRDGTPGEVYNVSSGIELENIEVAKKILQAVGGSEDLITFVEDRAGHDQRYAVATDKIKSLGWAPRVSFEKGLHQTVDYYSDND
jgi:dTDP-glucose 4,6-dehydratase